GTRWACSTASASGASGSSLTAPISSSSSSGKASRSCSYASASGTSSRSIASVLPRFRAAHNAFPWAGSRGLTDAGGLALREDEPVWGGIGDERVAVAGLAPQPPPPGRGRHLPPAP